MNITFFLVYFISEDLLGKNRALFLKSTDLPEITTKSSVFVV